MYIFNKCFNFRSFWDNIFNLWAGGDRDTYLEEYRCPKCNTELEVEMVPMFFVSEMD